MSYLDAARLWHDFFAALAGAAATLTGLLFVAISLRPREITGSAFLAERAANGLIALLGVVMTSLLMLFPGQYARGLVVAAGLIGLGQVLYALPRRRLSNRTSVGLRRRVAYDVVFGALGAAAVLGLGGWLPLLAYLLIAVAQLALIALSASGAWLLVSPHEDESHLFDDMKPDGPRQAAAGKARRSPRRKRPA